MTRMTRDFGDTMQKDAVPAVSADIIFASLRFPNYKIGVNNQIMETKDSQKVLSMKEVVARETAQLLDQQKRLSVHDLAIAKKATWQHPSHLSFLKNKAKFPNDCHNT
ncbi:hypothetical protein JHK87_009746 [Glycine soja]|nr:hypothetical protein JHK87_009746 [Glycine soja]